MCALQTFAQMQHRISFAREQSIHSHSSFSSEFLKASSLELVRDENIPLLLRQLEKRPPQFLEQPLANVFRLRSSIARRKQIFELQFFAPPICHGDIAKVLRLFLAKQVRDAIARHLKQPAAC